MAKHRQFNPQHAQPDTDHTPREKSAEKSAHPVSGFSRLQGTLGNAALMRMLIQREPDGAAPIEMDEITVDIDDPADSSPMIMDELTVEMDAETGNSPVVIDEMNMGFTRAQTGEQDPDTPQQNTQNGEILLRREQTMSHDIFIGAIQALGSPAENGVVHVHAGMGGLIDMDSERQSAPMAIPADQALTVQQQLLDQRVERTMTILEAARAMGLATLNGTTDDTQRRAITETLYMADKGFLDILKPLVALRKKGWGHKNKAAQDAALAALQLSAVFSAESMLGDDANAKKKSQGRFGMDGDWCGMFAAVNYEAAGLDKDLAAGFLHVKNVEDYFRYNYNRNPDRVKKWIWATDPATGIDGWNDLETYHEARSAKRHWYNAKDVFNHKDLDIQPGDIVLIDRGNPTEANHIVTVQSYDKNTGALFTIGGNDGGYTVDQNPERKNRVDPKAGSDDARKEAATGKKLKKNTSGKTGVGIGMYDVNNQPDPSKLTKPTDVSPTRIFGIGRPSISDFENHFYEKKQSPDKPPTKKPKGV